MRLQGSIFIPLQWFLIRFAPLTRAVIIFLASIWSDLIWNSEFKLCSLHTHLLYRKAGNKKNKTKPSSRQIVGKKKKTPLFPLLTPTLCQGYWLLYASSFFFSFQLPVGKFWNSPPLHYMQRDIKDTVNAISLIAVVQLPSLSLKGSAFETLVVVV